MVTTRQTQAATATLNASQIRRSVIFGRPNAHPSRKDNAYGPLQFRLRLRFSRWRNLQRAE